MAAFSAAGIAEANAMRTGFTSVKLGAIAFIIPFFFVYQPGLLFTGDILEILSVSVTSIIGVIGLTAGLQRFLVTRCNIAESFILFASGLCLIYPGSITDLIGLGGIALIYAVQRFHGARKTVKE